MPLHRLHRIPLLTAGALLITTIGGCSSMIKDQGQVDPIVTHARSAPLTQPDAVLPDCSIAEWVRRAVSGSGLTCAQFANNTSIAKTVDLPALTGGDRSRRSQAQAELMTYSDQVCNKHVAGIYGTSSATNFDLGFLTMLLSGGAAVASGRAATNLAAGSALASGTRGLVNSEIYYGYIGPAVMTEVRALRADLRRQIDAKRACSIDDYPAQEAIGDALIYHDACSFSTGLASLLAKAGTTRVGEDKLRTAQLNAITAQLPDKKAARDAYEKQLDTLGAPKDSDTVKVKDQRAMLKAQLASTTAEIQSDEKLQSFAGIVDPNAGQALVSERYRAIDAAQKIVDTLKGKEGTPAYQSANDTLTRLWTDAAEANVLPGRIAEARAKLDRLDTERQRLIQDRNSLSSGSPNNAGLAAKLAAIDTQLAGNEKDMGTLRDGLAELYRKQSRVGGPDPLPRSIEPGVQACVPLQIATMH